ncbi:MAG: ATP-binding cassette domain-containing protein, partial [Nocardioidaceae bacterium]
LFILLRRLADGGTSIIFISHKLREVFDIADRITVLRRGRTALSVPTSDTDQQRVVAAMTGRTDVNLGRVEHQRRPGDVVLAADGVCTAGHDHDAALRDVSLAVRGGEIVGIAGVEGNGQTTLAEVLIGTATTTSGLITIANDSIAGLDVDGRRSLGLAYVPEDRHREGIPVNGTVLEGLTAGRLRAGQAPRPWANAFSKTLRRWAGEVIARYSITTPDAEARCSTLSGGNQQKVVIARELEDRPRCLLLAQPTRGVDLGAIEFIYERITQAVEHGCAVLLISADLDELLRLTDRVLVMYGGQIVAERESARTTREELGTYMTGSDTATSAA